MRPASAWPRWIKTIIEHTKKKKGANKYSNASALAKQRRVKPSLAFINVDFPHRGGPSSWKWEKNQTR
jgi:hypothetical protein